MKVYHASPIRVRLRQLNYPEWSPLDGDKPRVLLR